MNVAGYIIAGTGRPLGQISGFSFFVMIFSTMSGIFLLCRFFFFCVHFFYPEKYIFAFFFE